MLIVLFGVTVLVYGLMDLAPGDPAQRKLTAGIKLRPKGRPRKGAQPRDIVAEQAYEINRLKMENELLRDFMRSMERR